jgi:predicted nucleotidyltransferase
MIINNILNYIFTNSGNLAVLRVLNERVVGISGRETARLAGVSLRSAQLSLDNLVNLKIVKRQVGGREHLFTLNRESFISEEIITKLFSAEQKFKNSIYKEITKNLNPLAESIILFGSVARKEESLQSDLDLCIVYLKNKNKIEKIVSSLRDELYDKFGVTLAPFYITRSEFKIRAKKNISPVNEIIKEGIVISGLSLNILKNG